MTHHNFIMDQGQSSGQEFLPPLPRIAIQAFCESQEFKHLVQSSQADRRMSKVMLKVQEGGMAACLEAYRGAPTPNVIIVEASQDRQGLLTRLDELAQYCDAGTQVLVVGQTNDVVLYRELMRRGVSEYLVTPISVMDLIGTLSNMFQQADGAAKLGRVITFIGAKGGVGSSTIAHNVAFTIASDLELATTLVDLDLPYGTAALDFNQDPPQGIADAVFAPDRLDTNVVDRLLSKCTENLSLLSAPSTLERTYDFRETDFDAVIDILRSNSPAIILDMPHVWNGWSRRLLTSSDEIVIVASPDLANLRNTKTLLDIIRPVRPNDSKPLIILNNVGMPKRPEIGISEFAKALDCEVAAALPFDPALFGTASNNGQMLTEVQSKSKHVELISEISRRVTGRSEGKAAKKSLLAPFLSKLKIKAA
jgi:pilus assembly protein CpaE